MPLPTRTNTPTKPSYVSEFLTDNDVVIPPYRLTRSTRPFAGSKPLSRKNSAILAATLQLAHQSIVKSIFKGSILKKADSQITSQHLREAISVFTLSRSLSLTPRRFHRTLCGHNLFLLSPAQANTCLRKVQGLHIAGTHAPITIFRAALQKRYRARLQKRLGQGLPINPLYSTISFV
jgi:hypothetical protein